MGEQVGMHAGEFSRPGSHEEQDDVVASMLMIFSNRRTLKSFHKQQSLFIIPLLKTLGVMAKVTKLSINKVRGKVLKHPLSMRFQLLNCHGCHRKLKFFGRALQRAGLHEKGGPSGPFLQERDLELVQ